MLNLDVSNSSTGWKFSSAAYVSIYQVPPDFGNQIECGYGGTRNESMFLKWKFSLFIYVYYTYIKFYFILYVCPWVFHYTVKMQKANAIANFFFKNNYFFFSRIYGGPIMRIISDLSFWD